MPRQKSIARLVAEPLLVAIVLAAGVRAAVSIYSIPSASMLPSLQIGDHILVTPYRLSAPRRGHVIVFRAPGNASQLLVKRVIGLPGDMIDSRGGRVRIGEHALSEPYLFRQPPTRTISAQVVPADSFFVMGDNRDDSVDSRRWGTLPGNLVVGRVRMVLWSSDDAGGDQPARASSVSTRKSAGARSRLNRIFKCVE
jgi:signal peptidase I